MNRQSTEEHMCFLNGERECDEHCMAFWDNACMVLGQLRQVSTNLERISDAATELVQLLPPRVT